MPDQEPDRDKFALRKSINSQLRASSANELDKAAIAIEEGCEQMAFFCGGDIKQALSITMPCTRKKLEDYCKEYRMGVLQR